MESFNEAWDLILNYCREHVISDIGFETWIKKIKPIKFDFESGNAVLLVPNFFHRNVLNASFKNLLHDAFMEVFGCEINIKILIPEDIDMPEDESKPPIILETEYEYTFDTFIVGSSNKFAHAASLAVATNPAGAYNPLFIHGNSGLGKTHLMYAIGKEIKKNNPDKNIIYVKGDDFANELIESIQMGRPKDFRQKYRTADVLLVDDVQFIGGKESTQEEFFHTFNTLHESSKQIVLTSDRPPKEIKTLEDRLRTRFEGGLIADVQPPDLETRMAIIKRKADHLNLIIPDEVCEYIATKLNTNIRQLEGVVKKIKAKNKLTGQKVTISSAHDTIADILNDEIPAEVTVEKIVDEVARTCGIKADDIKSKNSRKANIIYARQISIYIVRELTSLSMAQIGDAFGGRHHSTIVYTIQQVGEDIKKDKKTKETVEDIIKNIRDR